MSQQDQDISAPYHGRGHIHTLHRTINWKSAFWVTSGVPVLVLFSMGAISATVGKPAWLVWIISISFGFIQAFTYAEIASLFPHKSGGTSIYGAVAWIRYSKIIAPISIWCNWLAWSPVLAIGSGLSAGYILNALFPADAVINTWQLVLFDLSILKQGLSLRIDATFIVGATVLLLVFAVQNGGILRSARITMILGVTALLPLMLIGIVPLLSGDLPREHFFPLVPLQFDSAGDVISGEWNMHGWVLFAGGLFIAGWSAYAFETAACYTREFKNPKRDTFKAIFYSGLMCLAVYIMVPVAFQGYLGQGEMIFPAQLDSEGSIVVPAQYSGMLAADIYSGVGVANALASVVGNNPIIANMIVVMLILAMLLAIMTAMSGASRTLYQGSADGLLPKFLSHVNEDGAPTNAMWANLVFNLLLLLMSDYVFVLAASNVGYIIFNFLNLNAGWIHRLDRGSWERPFKAPNVLLLIGVILAFVNVAIMGLGANVWGEGALLSGFLMALLVIPIFLWRHYVTDNGQFPKAMQDDIKLEAMTKRRAGYLPYLAIAVAVLIVYFTNGLAVQIL
ncbi:MAG: APC family permease [Methylophaga sp.]